MMKNVNKRINPSTGTSFKRGEEGEDGSIFWGYSSTGLNKAGYSYESWVSREQFEQRMARLREHRKNYKKKAKEKNRSPVAKKRLNPKTKKPFKIGDIDNNGRYFLTYTRSSIKGGYIGEEWGDEKRFLRRMIAKTMRHARNRANQLGIRFDLKSDYLLSIFPQNYVCPVLHIKMEWNGNNRNSPSLDRLIPDLGYIKENVNWISNRANIMKYNRTPEMLRRIADWIDLHSEASGE